MFLMFFLQFVAGEGLKGDDPAMDPIQLPLCSFKTESKQEPVVKGIQA